MASLIQFKRGLLANLPTLAVGEPAFTSDSKEFFVGSSTGNIQLGDMLKSTYDSNGNGIVDDSEKLNGQAAAYYLARANHTGTQLSSTISNFSDSAKDAAGATVQNSATINLTYESTGKTITAVLADDAVTAAKINADVAGEALVQNASGALDVNVDGSTIEITSDALNVKDAGITTAKIADVNVTTAKLADSAVTTGKVADDAITAAKLAADVAGAALVQNGTTGAMDVNVDGSTIEITSDALNVKDSGITTAKLADSAVTTAKINDEAVTAAKLATDSVTTVKIADSAVTTAKVADGSITFAKMSSADVETDLMTSASASKLVTAQAAKNYADAVAQGLSLHQEVRLGTTANLNATYDNGTAGSGATLTNSGSQVALSVDGISAVLGDRILVKNQTDAKQNGIYDVTTVGSGSSNWVLTRSSDYDNSPSNEVDDGDFFFVTQGNTNADAGFVQINTTPIAIGMVEIEFSQFSGAGQIDAGEGLVKVGNTLNVNTDDSSLEVVLDTVQVKDSGIVTAKLADDAVTAAKLNADTAGAALVQNGTTGALDVNVDGSTIEITSDALNVKDSGIVTAKIADSAVTTVKINDSAVATAKIADDAVTAAKLNSDVAGEALVQNGTTGALDVNVDGSTIEITSDALNVKDAGITTAKLANNSVVTAKIADSNVTTAKIADDAVTAAKINADVAGEALVQNGTTGALDVNVDGSTIEITSDALNVKDLGITAAKLAADAVTTVKILNANVTTAKIADDAVTAAKLNIDTAGSGLVQNVTSGALEVNTDSSTLEVASGIVRVKDLGVTAAKLAANAVETAKIADDAVTAAKLNADVAGEGLVQNGTSGALDVNVDGSTLEINSDTVRVKDAGITASKLGADSVVTVKIADSNVTNAKLATDAVTTVKVADDAITAAKLNADTAGAALVQNGTTGALDVNVDNVTIEISSDAIQVKAITAAKITDFAEAAQDAIGDALYNVGTSVTLSYDDANGHITAEVNVDNSSIKKNGSNQLYVDLVDGGTF
jgi:trimeric autotransporter adhesin